MLNALFGVLDAFNYLVLLYFVALNSVYLVMSVIAFRSLRGYAIRLKTFDFQNLLITIGAPPITIIAPAFNEEATCVESVRSLLTLTYPEYEILVVNDGSTDDTLETLSKAFDLVPAARLPTASINSSPVKPPPPIIAMVFLVVLVIIQYTSF